MLTERRVEFPDTAWQQLQGLPGPLRHAAQRAIVHLLGEPVPSLAEPFPEEDPLPGAYRLHLPADGITIWYVLAPHEGQEVIIIQRVQADD